MLHKVALFALVAGTLAAQNPSFTGVVNPASNIPPGFSNYGIAQGSIFVVYGSNLGPASLVQATTLPLPTTAGLAGTSIKITVGGSTVTAPMLYTSAGQVAAVLPSTTPVGNGSLTLTFNGNSGSTPITVVQSNFGISTVLQSGSGPAVVTFPDYSLVTTSKSAKPGDTLVLWGTGLGPTSGSDADVPTQVDLGTPIQVFVGGVLASVPYRGRSAGVGLDQINFVVPPNAPLGCAVSIVVQTNGTPVTVSNGPTMSIAATEGAACSDATQIVPPALLSRGTGAKVAFISLKPKASFSVGGGTPTTSTSVDANVAFFQFSQTQLMQLASSNQAPSLGSCLTGIVAGSRSGGNGPPAATYLNGGTGVTLNTPSGSPITLAAQTQGSLIIYSNKNLTSVPSGTWGFSNAGGPDVGALNFNFQITPPVTWTNEASLASGPQISRSQPLTITWTGGDASGYVDIQGQGGIGNQTPSGFVTTYSYYFDCTAPTTAGSFTIPPNILLPMPTGQNAFASLQVSSSNFPFSTVSIPGFDGLVNGSQTQFNTGLGFK